MWHKKKLAEEIFNDAYNEYADALFRHCLFRLSPRERALELVQDTYMKLWDALQKGTDIKNIRALLYKMINNAIIDEYRKKKQTSLDALLEKEGVTEGIFDDLQTGSLAESIDILERRRDAETLHTALSLLQENYRQVLTLRYIDGLRVQEIADILKESQNTISVRINRALKKLKDYYKKES